MTACRLLSLALTLLFLAGVPAFAAGMDEVKHLIIIYGENRSFDNLYGLFPNAEGIATAEKTQTQLSKDGKIYEALPQPINTSVKPPPRPTHASRPTCQTSPSTSPSMCRSERRPVISFIATGTRSSRSTAARWISSPLGQTPPVWPWAITTAAARPCGRWRKSTPWPIISSTAPLAAPSSTTSSSSGLARRATRMRPPVWSPSSTPTAISFPVQTW